MRNWIGRAALLWLSMSTVVWAEPVTVAVDTSNPPFMYERAGKAAGLYPELVRQVAASAGIDFSIVALPWTRALMLVRLDKVGIAGIYKNSERLRTLDFSAPLFVETVWVYSLAKNPRPYKTITDLYGLRVGAIRGWSYGDEFDLARKQGKFMVDVADSDANGMSKLRAGRIDVMLSIGQSAQIVLDDSNDVVASEMPLREAPVYLAFSKSMHMGPLLTRFNQALGMLVSDGRYNQIVASVLKENP